MTKVTNKNKQNLNKNDEMKEMIKELKEQMIAEMKILMSEMQKSIQFMSDKFDNVVEELNYLKEENKKSKAEIQLLQKANRNLQEQLTNIGKTYSKDNLKLDDLEQYGRRQNLEFHGIPYKPNENTDYLIQQMAKKLNVKLDEKDISISHRLPTRHEQQEGEKLKSPPIIVKFCCQKKRNEIYDKRKNVLQIKDFGIPEMTELFINENLTAYRKSLLFEARKLKKLHDYNYIWTKMGEVLIRKNSNSKVLKITTNEDLKLIC